MPNILVKFRRVIPTGAPNIRVGKIVDCPYNNSLYLENGTKDSITCKLKVVALYIVTILSITSSDLTTWWGGYDTRYQSALKSWWIASLIHRIKTNDRNNNSSAPAEMGDRFGYNRHGPKSGELGPHLTHRFRDIITFKIWKLEIRRYSQTTDPYLRCTS